MKDGILPVIKARKMGIDDRSGWGAGCFVYEEQDGLEIFQHHSQCGFAWDESLQKEHDSLTQMGMMTEIKRLRKVGDVINHSAMADAFTQDLIKRIFK